MSCTCRPSLPLSLPPPRLHTPLSLSVHPIPTPPPNYFACTRNSLGQYRTSHSERADSAIGYASARQVHRQIAAYARGIRPVEGTEARGGGVSSSTIHTAQY
eukprot:1353732-Rhodomonas_salina.1